MLEAVRASVKTLDLDQVNCVLLQPHLSSPLRLAYDRQVGGVNVTYPPGNGVKKEPLKRWEADDIRRARQREFGPLLLAMGVVLQLLEDGNMRVVGEPGNLVVKERNRRFRGQPAGSCGPYRLITHRVNSFPRILGYSVTTTLSKRLLSS